jgi:hypothetical protein
VEGERPLAVLRPEPGIARREREAVRVADRRDDVERDGDVEVAHHARDDHHLLGVLLPEEGHVGADDVEQLAHDGAHACEVARPALGALQHRREPADGDLRREPRGVDLAHGRGEEHVHAEPLGDRRVGGLRARVGVEVRGLVELRGVDEEGHHDEVAALPRGAHERLMTRVEGAHRGD